MRTNKSPYSHQSTHTTTAPLFANALHNKYRPPNKNKQDTEMHLHNINLNRHKTTPGLEIDLECNQLMVAPTFQQDLTCNQELQLYACRKDRPLAFKQAVSTKANERKLQNCQKEQISPKPKQKKIIEPTSIDLHCAQIIANFEQMRTRKMSKLERQNNFDDGNNDQKLQLICYRMSEILKMYQKECRKKQEKIDYLEAKNTNRRL